MNSKIIVACVALCGLVCAGGAARGQAKGKNIVLGVSEQIVSKQLGEMRTLNIYVPEGYSDDDTAHYPVIYLLDGGMDEDFVHVVGLVQFNTQPWVARLPRSIVVGIVNTDRKRDMTYPSTVKSDKALVPTGGGSARFMAFIEQEVQPYMAQHYRVNKRRTLIGESLGGLLAAEVLLKKPGMFDRYIIISPSLWWDNGALLKTPLPAMAPGTNVYIGVGKEGLGPGAVPHMMEADANVLADKVDSAHVHVVFDYLPDENHATIAHHALYNAMRGK